MVDPVSVGSSAPIKPHLSTLRPEHTSQALSRRAGKPIHVIDINQMPQHRSDIPAFLRDHVPAAFHGHGLERVYDDPKIGGQILPELSMSEPQGPQRLYGPTTVDSALILVDHSGSAPEKVGAISRVPEAWVRVPDSPELRQQFFDLTMEHEATHASQLKPGGRPQPHDVTVLEWDAERNAIKTYRNLPSHAESVRLTSEMRSLGNFLYDNTNYSMAGLLDTELPAAANGKHGMVDRHAAIAMVKENDDAYKEAYVRAYARMKGEPITADSATVRQSFRSMESFSLVQPEDPEVRAVVKVAKEALNARAAYSSQLQRFDADPVHAKPIDPAQTTQLLEALHTELQNGSITNETTRVAAKQVLSAAPNILVDAVLPASLHAHSPLSEPDPSLTAEPRNLTAAPSQPSEGVGATSATIATANTPANAGQTVIGGQTLADAPTGTPTGKSTTGGDTLHSSNVTTSTSRDSVPQVHTELKTSDVHGRGGVLFATAMGLAVTGAALLNGASKAQAARNGLNTIVDGAVPGASDGFKNITHAKGWVETALNTAETATGATATGAAVMAGGALATAGVTSPLALAGPAAAVPAGALAVAAGAGVVAGVAGAANFVVGVAKDAAYTAGLSESAGPIHGAFDLAGSYVTGIKRQIWGDPNATTVTIGPEATREKVPVDKAPADTMSPGADDKPPDSNDFSRVARVNGNRRSIATLKHAPTMPVSEAPVVKPEMPPSSTSDLIASAQKRVPFRGATFTV